jgi:hypothetical protein
MTRGILFICSDTTGSQRFQFFDRKFDRTLYRGQHRFCEGNILIPYRITIRGKPNCRKRLTMGVTARQKVKSKRRLWRVIVAHALPSH